MNKKLKVVVILKMIKNLNLWIVKLVEQMKNLI